MLAWLLAGVLTLIGALVCAELASAFPRTGGVYVFLRETYSPPLGFLWGWAMFWSMHTGIIAAIAMVFARYAGFFVPLGDTGVRGVVAIGVDPRAVGRQLPRRALGSRVQTTFTVAKVAAVVADRRRRVRCSTPAQRAARGRLARRRRHVPSLAALLLRRRAGLFAFGGWHMVTYTGRGDRRCRRARSRAR